MPFIEKPNRAEILAENDRRKRERALNTRSWSEVTVIRWENGVEFHSHDYDSYAEADYSEAAEIIEFIKEGYQKIPL